VPSRKPISLPQPTPQRTRQILDALERAHPEARCALDYGDAFQLSVATILSAQCTDERVNMVTPQLFARYPDAPSLAAAPLADVEEIIRSTGFFRAKARSITGFAKGLLEKHGGRVPRTIGELVPLPGVGRKTANVVLGHAYGVNEGIAVDTHVHRVSNRLGLVREDDPLKIEAQLMALVPRERWTRTTDLLIFHGRKVCDARRPLCGSCPIFALCGWESRQAWASGETKPVRSARATAAPRRPKAPPRRAARPRPASERPSARTGRSPRPRSRRGRTGR
jgi:endonuclease III